jgi:hypothetical protein
MKGNKFLIFIVLGVFLVFSGCGKEEQEAQTSPAQESTGSVEDTSQAVKETVSEPVEAVKDEAVDSVQQVGDTATDAADMASEHGEGAVTSPPTEAAEDVMGGAVDEKAGNLEGTEKTDSSEGAADTTSSDVPKTDE